MIWYNIPVSSSTAILFLFLLAAALQTVLAMESGEWMRDKLVMRTFSLLYILLSALSFTIAVEMTMAVSTIETGAFVAVTLLPRYLAVLLPLLYFYYVMATRKKFPLQLHPLAVTFFIPLLLLPWTNLLPVPLPAVLAAFAAAWFIADAVRMFWLGRLYARSDVTRDILRHIIHSFDYGICIADRRGFAVESNPSFEKLWQGMGLSKFDHMGDMEADLQSMCSAGTLSIIEAENGRMIRKGDKAYFLRREYFKAGINTYLQYSLSDVTLLQKKITALELDNAQLEMKNMELKNAMSGISLEASLKQREKLHRAMHDTWSHKLAVAGLSVDILLRQGEETEAIHDSNGFAEIAAILEQTEPVPRAEGLQEFLMIMTNIYEGFGVRIQRAGKAGFCLSQQEILCHVLREGLANAVRHAYARNIEVTFQETENRNSMTIKNDCLDKGEHVSEGRGLHDIKSRVQEAGGEVQYVKNEKFQLDIMFPKGEEAGG